MHICMKVKSIQKTRSIQIHSCVYVRRVCLNGTLSFYKCPYKGFNALVKAVVDPEIKPILG